jgi:TM2 domain-containing membrane protein YozV
MNCANHPDQAVSAYCQQCGKGLCAACTRQVGANIYCEQCLAARLSGVPTMAGVPGGVLPPGAGAPNPGLATLLGFIPGVGAMYNGQYVKAIVHVLVFVVLVGIAGNANGPVDVAAGILIPAWILYQVFDAYHTARARRFGLPVPDPFGLDELGNRVGLHNAAPYVPPAGVPPVPPDPLAGAAPYAAPYVPVADPAAQTAYPPPPDPASAGFSGGPTGTVPPYAPFSPIDAVPPPPDIRAARREPIGAIVLIGLGMLFLFNTLGFFRFNWVEHGWPLIIIAIGIWLLISRARYFSGRGAR